MLAFAWMTAGALSALAGGIALDIIEGWVFPTQPDAGLANNAWRLFSAVSCLFCGALAGLYVWWRRWGAPVTPRCPRQVWRQAERRRVSLTKGAAMPRWVFLLGVGLLLVAVAFVVTCEVLGPKPGVTEANVRRIKPGMTVAEVDVLLGVPGMHLGDWVGRMTVWYGGDGQAVAWLDDDDKVSRVEFRPAQGAEPGPIHRLRKAFGR